MYALLGNIKSTDSILSVNPNLRLFSCLVLQGRRLVRVEALRRSFEVAEGFWEGRRVFGGGGGVTSFVKVESFYRASVWTRIGMLRMSMSIWLVELGKVWSLKVRTFFESFWSVGGRVSWGSWWLFSDNYLEISWFLRSSTFDATNSF